MVHDYGGNIGYYDRNAGRYESASRYFLNKYKDNVLREELEKCVALTGRNQLAVLEIGPGTGYLLGKLVKIKGASYNYTGVEHSSEMTKILLSRFKYRVRNLRVLEASVSVKYLEENLIGNKYDLILGSSILHQLPDHEEVVKKLSRMLNVNGVMYFVREPVHKRECAGSTKWRRRANGVYEYVDSFLSKPENAKRMDFHVCREGVSRKPFMDLCEAGYRLAIYRKYNRRASSFMSYVENRWLGRTRIDICGNTMFSIGIQRLDRGK